jgi:hypothetical protein
MGHKARVREPKEDSDVREAKHLVGHDCISTEHPMRDVLEGATKEILPRNKETGVSTKVTLYILQDGRPAVTHVRESYDETRCEYILPRDLALIVIREFIEESISRGDTRYTPENARKWLTQFEGCAETDVYRLACDLDPWAPGYLVRTAKPYAPSLATRLGPP